MLKHQNFEFSKNVKGAPNELKFGIYTQWSILITNLKKKLEKVDFFFSKTSKRFFFENFEKRQIARILKKSGFPHTYRDHRQRGLAGIPARPRRLLNCGPCCVSRYTCFFPFRIPKLRTHVPKDGFEPAPSQRGALDDSAI